VSALHDARVAIAAAATSPGLPVHPYPPDNASPPCGWVDSLTWTAEGGMFGGSLATADLLFCGQRTDRQGTTRLLEDAAFGQVGAALETIEGLRVVSAESGHTEIGGDRLPAVIHHLQFHLAPQPPRSTP
jgi:hypothetical protein